MNTLARRRDVNITQATGAEFTEKGLGVMVVPVYLVLRVMEYIHSYITQSMV